jgi:hypothetical protein
MKQGKVVYRHVQELNEKLRFVNCLALQEPQDHLGLLALFAQSFSYSRSRSAASMMAGELVLAAAGSHRGDS